jgi:hypothetical protein
MSTRKLSKKELIKQIATEVDDPELKEQLIDALLEQERSRSNGWESQPHMAVHPDAVPSNIRLQKTVLIIVGLVLFLLMTAWANGTPETNPNKIVLRFMSIFMPAICLLKYKHLSNISKWQRRGRKPSRKFWGAMIRPPVDEK